jgi:hypothetical protein
MSNDERLFQEISVPWMSADPIACTISEGRGLSHVFENERAVDRLGGATIDMTGFEFVGLFRGAFAGMNAIAWLVFVRSEE